MEFTLRTGDPEIAREVNRSLVLNYIRNNGVSHHAGISKRLFLSKVTVTSIIDDLIKEGLVNEIGIGTSLSVGGRKPILIL